MPEIEWFIYPDNLILSGMDGWEHLGKGRYRAVRYHYVFIISRTENALRGPIFHQKTLPANAEFKMEKKFIIVKKLIDTITSTIQKTLSSKITEEVGATSSNEVTVSPNTFKLQNSIQYKTAIELSEAITSSLSGSKTYEVTNTEEVTSSITLKEPVKDGKDCTYYFYLPIRVCTMDIYLYKEEIVELEYSRRFSRGSYGIWKIRGEIKSEDKISKTPIQRLMFYQPEESPSIVTEYFESEIKDPFKCVVTSLADSIPYDKLSKADLMPLKDLVSFVFPVTRKEKEDASEIRENRDREVEKLKKKLIREISSIENFKEELNVDIRSKGTGAKEALVLKDIRSGKVIAQIKTDSLGKKRDGVKGIIAQVKPNSLGKKRDVAKGINRSPRKKKDLHIEVRGSSMKVKPDKSSIKISKMGRTPLSSAKKGRSKK